MTEANKSLGGQWEGGHTHTHIHTHASINGPHSFGHRDAPEQVGSNGVREGNAHLTPRGGSSCARGRFASIRLPAPHGTIGATYPIVNGVRFIPVNPSLLLKVALPLGFYAHLPG